MIEKKSGWEFDILNRNPENCSRVDWKWMRLDGKTHVENGFHCGVVNDQKFSLFSLKEILLTPYKLHLLLVSAG